MADSVLPERLFEDVRMRGFSHRTTVAAAIDWLDSRLHQLPAEVVPLPFYKRKKQKT